MIKWIIKVAEWSTNAMLAIFITISCLVTLAAFLPHPLFGLLLAEFMILLMALTGVATISGTIWLGHFLNDYINAITNAYEKTLRENN